ncbi:hypothetical protein CDD83_238 [Cordyceps sp. RAO-2017]|nr:hypothetical protein CDD83_238 [Cordyceps sp. RAO-2017]
MRSPLGLVLAAAAAALGLRAAADSEREVRNVAIIGAGAAGASTAYHLRQYAQAAGLAVNVTIFERGGRAGGRSLTVGAYGDAAQPLELGASIFVSLNQILCNASRALGLTLAEAGAGAEPGDVTLVWDGADVVFRSVEGEAWWWLAGRLLWRYGAAPYRAVRLVRAVVANFLRLYDPPFFPFRSLTRRVYELGLHKVTGLTGEQFLAENKIDAGFARDVMQPATRVNYASNLAHIHGLEAMVSFATDGAQRRRPRPQHVRRRHRDRQGRHAARRPPPVPPLHPTRHH